MDLLELKREQEKLSHRISLRDTFKEIKTIGAAECHHVDNKILACVVVCEFPSFKIKEKKTYLLENSLPYRQGFEAYREMPAIIEAFNQLEEEPDVLLVKGAGVLHPLRIGVASHAGLVLNIPTIGVQDALYFGTVQDGKVLVGGEILGFEIKTKEYSNPIYVSPGHNMSLGSALNLITKTIIPPHKLPEPLHLAHKIGRKMTRGKE